MDVEVVVVIQIAPIILKVAVVLLAIRDVQRIVKIVLITPVADVMGQAAHLNVLVSAAQIVLENVRMTVIMNA